MTSPSSAAVFTPYTTVKPFLGTAKSYLDSIESDRVLSYDFYDQLYWNVSGTLKIVARGSNAIPIYMPSARTIVKTINRYTATGFNWEVLPGTGPDAEVANATAALTQLFARERFLSKFSSNKLFGTVRGDWAWHLLGDADKAPGTRIDIRVLHPGTFQAITHPRDVEHILGYDIFEEFDDGGTVKLRVQRYSKVPDPIADPDAVQTGLIYSSLSVWQMDAYADQENKGPEAVLSPIATLPPAITALPIYHIRNVETPGDPYGSSELRGYETLLGAINQGASDEDMALALEGLGVYATTSGPPLDRTTRQPQSWRLGPGRIAELSAGTNMWRINGVGSVGPYQDHLNYLMNGIKESSGATDAAAGKIDVTVAESGISLLLQLGPILAEVSEKDRNIVDVHRQMFFDLVRGWLPAYEQLNFPNVIVEPVLGSKLPIDKGGEIDRIIKIVAQMPGLAAWAVRQLTKLGYDFTAEEITAAAESGSATADPFADRANAELTGGSDDDAGADPGAASDAAGAE